MNLCSTQKKYLIPTIIVFAILGLTPAFTKAFSHQQFPINEEELSGEYDTAQKAAIFHGKEFDTPEKSADTKISQRYSVLGATKKELKLTCQNKSCTHIRATKKNIASKFPQESGVEHQQGNLEFGLSLDIR